MKKSIVKKRQQFIFEEIIENNEVKVSTNKIVNNLIAIPYILCVLSVIYNLTS